MQCYRISRIVTWTSYLSRVVPDDPKQRPSYKRLVVPGPFSSLHQTPQQRSLLFTLKMFSLFILALPLFTFANPLQPRSTSVKIPATCDVIPVWTVSNFNWFNSTHNLDCVTGPDIGDGTTCFNSTPSGNTITCDPSQGPCATCGVPACYTGLPYVPLGYGPPDSVTFSIKNGYSCSQTNPQSVHRAEVGEGYVNCGGTAYYASFYGNSNSASGTGRIDYNPIGSYQCKNGSMISVSGSVSFPISCTHDSGFNATCTAKPFVIPVTAFTIS